MSDLYQSIPPERRNAFIANAEQALMGKFVVQDAVRINSAHSGELETVAVGADSLLSEQGLLTDEDMLFLVKSDVKTRRANGEQPEMSFEDMFAEARKANIPKPAKDIDE
jgi:hypothetical protein